jgi:hypothetical protein
MKVLIIDNFGSHLDAMGGTELYSKMLVDFFYDRKDEIDEIHFDGSIDLKTDDKKTNLFLFRPSNSKSMYQRNKKFQKLFQEHMKNHKYDLIINNPLFFSSKMVFHNTPVIQIQHVFPLFYNFASTIGFGLSGLRSKQIKYMVGYTKYDIKSLSLFNRKKYFSVPLPYFDINHNIISFSSKPNNIGIFGRLSDKVKNIKFACKISKYVDSNFLLYGSIDEETLNYIKKFPNVKYMGKYVRSDLKEIYKQVRFLLLPSKFEGFGYVCTEALANATPIIIRNSFPASKYLVDQGRNGLLFSKFLSAKQIGKKINTFKEKNKHEKKYFQLQKQCFNFYKQNLTIQQFNSN